MANFGGVLEITLPNPSELKKLLKVCREFGVESVEVGALKVKFGELPREDAAEEANVPNMPSDEELLFWSAQPDPLAERVQ